MDEPAVIGDAGLFIVDPDTKAARRVVEGSLMDAVWLGDKQIAFIRNAAIWVVNADGSGERKLQQGIVDGGMRSLHLSPDRRWIAYVSESGGSGDRSVYVMRSDGSGRRQVFADTLNETMGWSPDSKRLAFVGFDGQSPGMYVYDLAEDRSTLLYGAFLDQPTWTPDGSEIVFFDGSIMAIDVATGQYRQLAHPPEFAPTPIILSRDGREVYYARYDDASEATWWSIALDGGTPQKIGSGTHAFLWSRSDDRAAIVERTGEQDFDYRWITRLVVAAPDLSDRTTVAIAGTYTTIYGQRWSPHGKRLLVRANQLRTPHKRP